VVIAQMQECNAEVQGPSVYKWRLRKYSE
jgi:hypothetical protein